jgi:Tfp pilus assembly protein PilV
MTRNPRIRRLTLALGHQAGFTLHELLVVATMLVIIVLAVFGLYRVAANEQSRIQSSASGLQAQRIGLERMTRELRKASIVCQAYPTCAGGFTNSTSIDFKACTASSSSGCSEVWIRYNCSGSPAQAVPPAFTPRACLRSESTSANSLGGAESVLIGDVATSPTGIFTFTSPDYVTVSMRVVTKGASNPISIQDGVRLRNAGGS